MNVASETQGEYNVRLIFLVSKIIDLKQAGFFINVFRNINNLYILDNNYNYYYYRLTNKIYIVLLKIFMLYVSQIQVNLKEINIFLFPTKIFYLSY